MNKPIGFRVQGSGFRNESSPAYVRLPPSAFRLRCGFSLLEVLLALGLTAVVLGLVGTAVNSTLRTVESGKRRTEREQLARAVMHRIADDLRAVVRYEPFDASGLTSSTGGMSGSSGSGTSSSGTSSGTSGQTGSNTTNQNSSNTGTSGNTSSNSSSQSSGSQSTSQDQTDQTTTLPVAGIYGYPNQTLQIDITRIPRLDEYLYANGVTAPLSRGDVRTVTYYLGGVQNNNSLGATAAKSPMNSSTMNGSSGLVRLEADRMTSLWQMQSGSSTTSPNQSAVVLAPEVASINFRYFDGAMWYTQWDSTTMNGIPRAVEISIYLYDDPAAVRSSGSASSSAMGAAMNNPDNFYQMVVHLPAGLPLPVVQPVTDDSSQQNSSTNSNSSTGTSTGTTSGTTQNGGK